MLDRIPLDAGDHVIDVGANVGVVSRLLGLQHGVIPLAFEPEQREFVALQANLAAVNGHAWNVLLWSHQEQVEFHEANDSGDSSIFANERAAAAVTRSATTLDAVIGASSFADTTIKLLKLEAEGAEPEILAGATQTLERTEFVVADVGPERGADRATTLIPVYEHLHDAGFRAIDVQHRRLVMLFRRK
jgi:FkbM family methyltransferase